MLTVACVYWKGKFRGRENIYTADWVLKLKNMVARSLSLPHEFVCLTNTTVECSSIPLLHDWPGWWSKIELFRPGLFSGRTLFLDLDCLPLRDLDAFFNYPAPFATLVRGVGTFIVNKEGKREVKLYNSSVMVFDAGVADNLYLDFNEDIIKEFRGDQDYIGAKYPMLLGFPKAWVRKIGECSDGKPTSGMKIALSMPDKNNVAAKKHGWVKEVWR